MTIPPILRVPLKYGFFGGLLGIAVMLFIFYFGTNHPQLFPVFLDFRILLFAIFIFFSIREFRDFKQAGVLHFWQGMIIGMACYLTISLVVSVFLGVFGTLVPEYTQHYIDEIGTILRTSESEIIEKVGEEAYKNQVETLPFTTITDLAVDYLLKSMFIGLFLTIIISVILRRQPKN